MGRKGVFKTEEGKKAIIDHYDGLMKGIPVDYTEHFADTSFGQTYVIETGMASKPKVIFGAFNFERTLRVIVANRGRSCGRSFPWGIRPM